MALFGSVASPFGERFFLQTPQVVLGLIIKMCTVAQQLINVFILSTDAVQRARDHG